MIRSGGRRAALVVAVVGLLAALTSGAVSGSAPGAVPVISTAATSVALIADSAAVPTPTVGLVRDGLRVAHPVAARVGSTERPIPAHAAGWALAALLLLLAACALAVGVRRAAMLAPPSARRSASAPRAPPALASC